MSHDDIVMIWRMAEKIEQMSERIERIGTQLDALEHCVFRGNGRPAMISRLDALEANQTGRSHVLASLLAAIGALGVAIIGALL